MNAHKMSLKAVLILCALMTLMGVPLAYAALRPVTLVQPTPVAQVLTVAPDKPAVVPNVPTLDLTPKKPEKSLRTQFRAIQEAVETHSCSVESRVGGTVETCR